MFRVADPLQWYTQLFYRQLFADSAPPTDLDSPDFWTSDSFLLWRMREIQLHLNIAVCLSELKDYTQAAFVLKSTLAAMNGFHSISTSLSYAKFHEQVTSAIGRCYLQLGDVDIALEIFRELELRICGKSGPPIGSVIQRISGPARPSDVEAEVALDCPAEFFQCSQVLMNR